MKLRMSAWIFSLLLATASWAFGRVPQDSTSAKQDMKDAGQNTKAAAKDTGSATKKTAKKTTHAAKNTTNKAAKKTQQGCKSRSEQNPAKQPASTVTAAATGRRRRLWHRCLLNYRFDADPLAACPA